MRRPTRTLTAAAAAIIGLAALTGCGDTDEPTADEAPSDDGGSGAPDGDSVDCEAQPGDTITVEIPEFSFAPDPVEIGACDSVVWENTHDQSHTSTGNGDKTWSTDNVAAGESSEPVLFEEAGSYAYICALHPFMKGTVEVA
jgi:plastocyanin